MRADWTLAKGIRRASIHLVLGVVLGTAYVTVLFVLLQWPLAWLASNTASNAYAGRAVSIFALPFAAPLVWLLWHRFRIAAGFGGLVIVGSSLVAALMAVALATRFVVHFVGTDPSLAWAVSAGIMLGFVIWVVYSHLTD